MGRCDRRLTVNALGSRERLSAKLARAGEMLSIPAQQTPGGLDLGTRDHACPLAGVGPENSAQLVDVSITLKLLLVATASRGRATPPGAPCPNDPSWPNARLFAS